MSRTAAHVALVGLSGTGKSTVAPLLAERLGLVAVDLDRAVEAAEGRPVAEIFAADGESRFRDLEAAALAAALAGPPAVVATGGGVVVRPANRAALAAARVVWLRADVAELAARLQGTAERRPLLDDDPEARLRALEDERTDWFAEVADVTVPVGGRTVAEVVDEVARALRGPVAC